MAEKPDDRSPPLAKAVFWLSQITTVVLEMVLPGVGGAWLDKRWGTGFLSLAGLAFGLALGLWHLVNLNKLRPPQASGDSRSDSNRQPHGEGRE